MTRLDLDTWTTRSRQQYVFTLTRGTVNVTLHGSDVDRFRLDTGTFSDAVDDWIDEWAIDPLVLAVRMTGT